MTARELFQQRLNEATAALSPADRATAVEWMIAAIDRDDISRGLVENLMNGLLTIAIRDGKPLFKLTTRGEAEAMDLIQSSPECRDLISKMADGKPVVAGPKRKQ